MIRLFKEADAEYGIHLTVYWGCSVKTDHVEDNGHKGGDTRKGVNL